MLNRKNVVDFSLMGVFSRKGRLKILPFSFEKRVIYFIFRVNILQNVKMGKYMSSSDLHFFFLICKSTRK